MTIWFIPFSNGRQVKISHSINNSTIYSFTIIDENGVKYTFAEGDKAFSGPFTTFLSCYISWQLTSIDLPYSSEPILFNYDYGIESEIGTVCQEPKISIYHILGCDGERKIRYLPPDLEPHYYRMKLLSAISYGSTSIELSYTDETIEQYDLPAYNYVNKIEVFENSSLIREIDFIKSMNNITSFCNNPIPLAQLADITIKGSNASDAIQKYECEYAIISDYFSGTDHWGYLDNGDNEELAILLYLSNSN